MGALRDKLLTIFGDIKFFRYPFFFVYDPGSYRVKGEDVRELLEVLEPGDVLLRAYDNYLDGLFIPGLFSHAAIYCGELTEADRARAGVRIADEGLRREAQKEKFKPGRQMVIHAMAEGVFAEDILTFSRCDKLAVLRLPEVIGGREGVESLFKNKAQAVQVGTAPDGAAPAEPDWAAAQRELRQRLEKGGTATRAEVAQVAVAKALGNLGRPYDFDFDFANFSRLSCSELVYYCYRPIDRFIDVKPRTVRVLFFWQRQAILPDAFMQSGLEPVWASRTVRGARAWPGPRS